MTPQELVDAYYEAWRAGRPLDPELFAADLVFVGPMGELHGRDAFLAGLDALGGVMKLAAIRRRFLDGDEACVIYDAATPAGVIPMAEWIHTRAGKIVRLEVFFDAIRLPRAG
ncbi:MAG TPA: nuclear transport factor 2 family protein [Polyangia bacterium]|jgi:hypothetical protein